MNRSAVLIAVLAAVLVAALFYFFAWQPKSEEIAEIDEQIQAVEQETQRLEQRVIELKQVRADAPEIESDIVAAESLVPRDIAMPGLLRQMQLAADESGADLFNITASRPTQVEDAQSGLAATAISVQLSGGYYQLVDFFRRVEDPAITPRGVVWNNLSLSGADTYPTLTASVSGQVYSLLPVPPAPAEEPTTEDGAEPDGDQETPEEATS